MTTHELARLLLDGPDVPVGVAAHDQWGNAISAGLVPVDTFRDLLDAYEKEQDPDA